jgi:hypothetical protein
LFPSGKIIAHDDNYGLMKYIKRQHRFPGVFQERMIKIEQFAPKAEEAHKPEPGIEGTAKNRQAIFNEISKRGQIDRENKHESRGQEAQSQGNKPQLFHRFSKKLFRMEAGRLFMVYGVPRGHEELR